MTDVILICGTVVEHEVVNGMTSEWKRIPRLTEIGAIGEQSDPKEKTTLEDCIKKYDSGLRDAPDKNLKGQYIPTQAMGDQYYADYLLQQEFITRCRNEEEFNVRVIWPDGDTNGWKHKALGFEFDQGTQEDWKMFTTNGKQNSRVIYELSVTGSGSVAVAATEQMTAVPVPANLDITQGVVYWKSSDELVATVDANGLVTGVGAGTCDITAEFRGVSGSLEVTVA